MNGRGARLGWLLLLGILPGCVERLLSIRSDPPGAEITLDGQLVGTTGPDAPVRAPFDFYGERVVVARLPGHLPVRREVRLEPPWYQYPPFDLLSELLWPGTIEDVHEVRLELAPRPALEPAGADALERRAGQLEGELRGEGAE